MPFKVRFRGFTLVELLIVLVIFLIVGSILFYLLIKALKWVSTTGGEVKQELSTEINTDLLVFDLKHAGYGISKNESKLVIEYKNKTLYVRSTLNPFKPLQPVGFQLCKGKQLIEQYQFANNWPNCSWFNLERIFKGSRGCNCSENPLSGFAIAYAIDSTTACQSSDEWCCVASPCTTIKWYLSIPSLSRFPKKCFSRTEILYAHLRNYPNPIPIINCVSDWDVWFGFDTNNDTVVDSWQNSTTSISSNDELKDKLKLVKIFMLVQASPTPDPNYDFCKQVGVNCTSSVCGNNAVLITYLGDKPVCLKYPNNEIWKHYRWKVIEITVTGFPNIP